jgi:hypothetical protein
MPVNPSPAVGTSDERRMQPDDAVSMIADGDYGAYQIALERRQVTFHHVAGAWFHLCEVGLNRERRERFRELFPQLIGAFAEPRGGIVTSYFCRHIRVAAALTDISRAAELPETVPRAARTRAEAVATNGGNGQATRSPLPPPQNGQPPSGRFQRLRPRVPHPIKPLSASSSAIHLEPTFGDPTDWQAKRLLFACLDLHYRALEFLTPKPRKICMRLAFGVIASLLGTLDSRRAPGIEPAAAVPDPAELECLERELARAERYYARSSQRTAQLEYFTGMLLLGLPLLVLAVASVALATGIDPLESPLLASLAAGGAGAVVSVMNRMTSGRLILVAESGKAIIRLLGAIRPLLGGVLGLALYVLLSAGLVSFAGTPDDGNEMLIAAALGFLAGFSERFAQDMIAGAAGGQTSTPATAAVQAEPSDEGSSRVGAGV